MSNPDPQSVFVLGAHYCVQLLPEVICFWNIPFTVSFAKCFSFTFLVSFIWNSQKWPISKIYDALLKQN